MKKRDMTTNALKENEGAVQPTLALGVPVRTYKDRVFRMLFKEKGKFLELYNAMNGTDYHKAEDLFVTTLENAIYLGMKNDVSFLLYDQLSLYEHQSTNNPNMPLRDLLYVANIYSGLTKDKNLYGSKLVKIPEPKFVVFYNGLEKVPERYIQKLSDAYEQKTDDVALELKIQVLNINRGYNAELMQKCRTLSEYTIFVDIVRRNSRVMPFSQAAEAAIDECVAKGILEDFLLQNRAEVLSVSIFEYNEEKHIQQERDEAELRGELRGEERLGKLISILLKEGKMEEAAQVSENAEKREEYYKIYGIEKVFCDLKK